MREKLHNIPDGLKNQEANTTEEAFAAKLRERLHETTSQKEKKLPKISLDIFYGTHNSTSDALAFKSHFAKADIFIPEGIGWSKKSLEAMRRVASGDSEVLARIGHVNNFSKAQLEMLYGSGKPVMLVDIPEGHPLLAEYFKMRDRSHDLADELWSSHKPLEMIIDQTRVNFRQQAELEKEREQYMLDNIEPQLCSALKKYPDLQKKKVLRPLMFLGAAHTGIYQSLSRGGVSVKRNFAEHPVSFPYAVEAIKKIYFGTEEPTDELVARSILEQPFLSFFNNMVSDTDITYLRFMTQARHWISVLNFEEVKSALDILRRGGESHANSALREIFSKKGIKLPEDAEELKKLLDATIK